MSADPIQIAYLAGIIDADGYVTASRVQRKGRWYCAAQVGITGSSREPHDLAADIFGGNVTCHQPNRLRAHHRMQYHWQRNGTQAVPTITAVLPYLRIKADRARLVLELQEQVEWIRATRGDDDPFPWMPAGYDPTNSLASLVEEIRSSNTRTGRELDGRTWDQYPTPEVAR